jgi:uncharacterized integral membrane protein
MKVLSWSLFLVFAVIAALFAIANRQDAVVSLDPLPFSVEAPLYLVVLVAVFGGFLIATAGAIAAAGRARRRLREAESRIARMKADIARASSSAAPEIADAAKDRPTLPTPSAPAQGP